MASFYKLKIKDVRRETPDCVSVAFDIPDNLSKEFEYIQGQYLTLKLNIQGEELRRSYSACSSPLTDADLRIAIKEVDNGKVSSYLNNGISVGDQIEVMKPMGNFYTEMGTNVARQYVAFAAGSGITPIISLLKTALAANADNTFKLFYGNKSTDDIIFRQELNDLVVRYEKRLEVHHILSREKTADALFSGRISPEKCADLLSRFSSIKSADEIFLCGPFDMIMGLKDWLLDVGIDKEHIHFELFTSDPPKPEKAEDTRGDSSSSAFTESEVTIVLDGEETIVKVDGETSILDAVLDAGLDAPYACTGGSCCTCRAKVLEGNAEMEVNYALTDSEVADGYILTCQSHPKTATMVVDYDAP